jgi:hypothetical protein
MTAKHIVFRTNNGKENKLLSALHGAKRNDRNKYITPESYDTKYQVYLNNLIRLGLVNDEYSITDLGDKVLNYFFNTTAKGIDISITPEAVFHDKCREFIYFCLKNIDKFDVYPASYYEEKKIWVIRIPIKKNKEYNFQLGNLVNNLFFRNNLGFPNIREVNTKTSEEYFHIYVNFSHPIYFHGIDYDVLVQIGDYIHISPEIWAKNHLNCPVIVSRTLYKDLDLRNKKLAHELCKLIHLSSGIKPFIIKYLDDKSDQIVDLNIHPRYENSATWVKYIVIDKEFRND